MLTLSIFLYIYLLFLLVWAIFSLTALYHLFKFGFKNSVTFLAIIVYLALSASILFISLVYISKINWQTKIISLPETEGNAMQAEAGIEWP
jgi:hypothetical protein